MIFTYDTDMTLMHAAALVNTGPALGSEHREDLPDVAALVEWMHGWQWTGRHPSTEAEADAVRRLRPRIRQIWGLPEDDLVDATNALLREGRALPQLVRHGDFDWHIHATPDDAPIADRIAVEVGMALVDVIRAGAPASGHQGLGEGPGRAKGRTRREHRDQTQTDVPPHRLDHDISSSSSGQRPAGAGSRRMCQEQSRLLPMTLAAAIVRSQDDFHL